MNPARAYMIRGLFAGLFLGIGVLVTMIGGIFSQIRTAAPMTGYVDELLVVGVISLGIGAGIVVWSWSTSKEAAQPTSAKAAP